RRDADRRGPDGRGPVALPAGRPAGRSRGPRGARGRPAAPLRRPTRPGEERGPGPPRLRARRLHAARGAPDPRPARDRGRAAPADGGAGARRRTARVRRALSDRAHARRLRRGRAPRPMTRTQQTHELVKAEILREKAAALGRAGERLEAALEAVAAIARRLDGSADAAERTRLLEDYEVARARARAARLALLIP